MERNPTLAQARAAADAASWGPLGALSTNIPHVSVSANHLFGVKYQLIDLPTGAQFEAVYPKTVLTLGAQWTLFDGLSTPLNVAAARDTNQAASHELDRSRFQLENEVKLRYFQTLAAEGLVRVAEQNLKTLSDHLARTKELLAQGQATRFDLLRTQTQFEEAEPEATEAADQFELARLALARATGLERDPRSLSGELPELPKDLSAFAPEKLRAETSSRDDIQALQLRSDAADRSKDAYWGAWSPRISLGFATDYYNNIDFSLSQNFRTDYSVGVYLSWNLFDGGYTLAHQKQAIAQAAQADEEARKAVLAVPGEIETWRRRLIYNVGLYHARTRAVESAQESVRLAKLGFGAGTRTNTDVLDAQLDLFRAAEGRIRAQIGALEALLNLESALGRRLGS
jgi:outer membrane protein TolC